MGLSFRDIMSADMTELDDAAAAWKRMSKRFGELRRDYNAQVRGHLAHSQWSGVAKVTFDEVATVSSGEFGNAKSQAEGIATLLTEAYEDLVARKKDLGKRVAEAEDDKMSVDGSGRVTLDTTKLNEGERLARGHDPTFASALDDKVADWQTAVDKAVEAVNEADAAIKKALLASVAPPGNRAAGMNGFNPRKVDYTPPGTRKDLDRILKDYQVGPDPGGIVGYPRNWILRAAVFSTVTVTEKEADMLDELGLAGLPAFNGIKEDAFDTADARFSSDDRNDDHNDAFRHSYWNALMTKKYGAEWTEKYTVAHEARPGNPPEREAMDLYNNEVGRRIASSHPDASEEELADLVEKAVRDGDMVVIPKGGGRLAFSDQVGPDATGDPTLSAPEGEKDEVSGYTDSGGSGSGKRSGAGSGS
ncbi:DUF6973 domain-containing protein [Streptomyces reniochalinae]|uniref:DUF6973 domain-containing protein n=1 Tax=Streptomyces reniochalinae TaxID=2250578 RepID=A0A367EJ38_9ACTN|nr:hypothetical protein [Streptomyces reniochalinae]RCG18116.1 hypothetical protein DQ392_15770 [Streptomyces reniochalinae]